MTTGWKPETPMTPALKEPWLEALRSGNYEQATGTLHRKRRQAETGLAEITEGFCCLGVLSEVACTLGLVEKRDDYLGYREYVPAGVENPIGSAVMPTIELEQVFGFDSRTSGALAEMNDGFDGGTDTRKSFAEIADWVEENL